MEEGRIVIDVETQTFRFTPSSPINHQEAVTLAGGSVSGPYVVVSHEQPRATFVIDGKGVIRHVWPKVKVKGHADEVLETVKSL